METKNVIITWTGEFEGHQNLLRELEKSKKRHLMLARKKYDKMYRELYKLDPIEPLAPIIPLTLRDIGSYGGIISGISRSYKADLNVFFLKALKLENPEFFKDFSSMNYQFFSSYFWETAPTKKRLLKFLDTDGSRRSRNPKNSHLFRKKSFIKFLKEEEFIEDRSFVPDFYERLEEFKLEVCELGGEILEKALALREKKKSKNLRGDG